MAEILAAEMVDENEWKISSGHEVRAAAQLLRPHCQPKVLRVELKTEVTCDQWKDMEVLMAKVTEVEYSGWLQLILHHSHDNMIQADSIIMKLKGSK